MRVLTLKTRTPANIKFPGYLEYTIKFKYYFHIASGVYGENTRMKRELREHIYLYISEISIDMNRECARFARSIMFVRTSSVHYLEYRTAHVLSAQNKRTEAERETGTA